MERVGKRFAALSLVVLLAVTGVFGHEQSRLLPSGKSCFCKLAEAVDECGCSVDSVDEFNNRKLYPVLQALLQKDFFRYYKVKMDKPCPFWASGRECTSRECGIESCDDEVPAGLKRHSAARFAGSSSAKSSAAYDEDSGGEQGEEDGKGREKRKDESNRFDPLDRTISAGAREQFLAWAEFDDAENKFCDVEEENSETAHYVDLSRNPERYTGFKGNSAQLVWKAIYLENCFKPNPKYDKDFLLYPTVTGLCLEKRVFFRLISGLHTSITISIAAHNFQQETNPASSLTGGGGGRWTRNVDMFKARFSPETTWGEGPQRLKNLYFAYLLELRALHKAAAYFRDELFYTGDEQQDADTRLAVGQLSRLLDQLDQRSYFDETNMFQQYGDASGRQLKEEFRQKFLNISRIMDCVDCDKCRLWGKVQAHGMGTALKILFSSPPPNSDSNTPPFRLTRNDVVALFQSLGRFSAGIREVQEFRLTLDADYAKQRARQTAASGGG